MYNSLKVQSIRAIGVGISYDHFIKKIANAAWALQWIKIILGINFRGANLKLTIAIEHEMYVQYAYMYLQ